jgi:hypothetical protein
MEEWVVSLLYGILDRPSYRDMTILGNIACDTYLYTYGDGEEYYLYTEGATRENSYNFIPYTGASYDYADEVVFGDKDGEEPEDSEEYPYGYGPIPLGRICDFNVLNADITEQEEKDRIDSFFRRFKIKTVEHASEGMDPPDPIYVDFKVCGHGLDDAGAQGATVEMELLNYTQLNEEGDYQCVYVSKKMYALVGGNPNDCVYLPDGKTADDVEYIRGALPTIQIFGQNVWDTPGLEFYSIHYSIPKLEALKGKAILIKKGIKLPGKTEAVRDLYIEKLAFAQNITVYDITISDSSNPARVTEKKGSYVTKQKSNGTEDDKTKHLNGIVLVEWRKEIWDKKYKDGKNAYEKIQEKLKDWVVAPVKLGEVTITYEMENKPKENIGPPYKLLMGKVEIGFTNNIREDDLTDERYMFPAFADCSGKNFLKYRVVGIPQNKIGILKARVRDHNDEIEFEIPKEGNGIADGQWHEFFSGKTNVNGSKDASGDLNFKDGEYKYIDPGVAGKSIFTGEVNLTVENKQYTTTIEFDARSRIIWIYDSDGGIFAKAIAYQHMGLLSTNPNNAYGDPIGTPDQGLEYILTGYDDGELAFKNALDRCTPRSTLYSIGHGHIGFIELEDVQYYSGFGAGTGANFPPYIVTYQGIHNLKVVLKHCQTTEPRPQGISVAKSLDKVLEPNKGVGSADVWGYNVDYEPGIFIRLAGPKVDCDNARNALKQKATDLKYASVKDWAANIDLENRYETMREVIKEYNNVVLGLKYTENDPTNKE